MGNIKLRPEIAEILQRSTLTGTTLKLPEQLDRETYQQVNKVIVLAGGKWNRRSSLHVFEYGDMSDLKRAMSTGVAVDKKKLNQAFYTPCAVAERVAAAADIRVGQRILEPSAGRGALLTAICVALGGWTNAGSTSFFAVELDPTSAKYLTVAFPMTFVIQGDFLKLGDDGAEIAENSFDRIIMNPPFTRGTDGKHIKHALRFLASGGLLVSVVAGGDRQERFADLAGSRTWYAKSLGAGAFKESGTQIETSVLSIYAN